MIRRQTFAAEPLSVPAARRFALEALSDAPAEARQSVELMVSELATNSIRHGRTSFDVVIDWNANALRVEVTDHGGGTPRMRFPGPDEPTGRGLQIVDMLAGRWGIEQESESGKTVWFTLDAARPAESGARSRAGGRRVRPPHEPAGWTFLARPLAAIRA